jgi:hypothetical protein
VEKPAEFRGIFQSDGRSCAEAQLGRTIENNDEIPQDPTPQQKDYEKSRLALIINNFQLF